MTRRKFSREFKIAAAQALIEKMFVIPPDHDYDEYDLSNHEFL